LAACGKYIAWRVIFHFYLQAIPFKMILMSYISLVGGLKLWLGENMFNNSHVVVEDVVRRARLRWRAKRGMLENDIFLTRFFDVHEANLTDDEVYGLDMLLDLPDSELFDLIMRRKELAQVDKSELLMDEADMLKANHVLGLLREV
jgi:antitoxin CptB